MTNAIKFLLVAVLFAGCASSSDCCSAKCGKKADCAKCEKQSCAAACKKNAECAKCTGSCGRQVCNCFAGRWAFVDSNWWMGVKKDAAGAFTATVLFGGGSPLVMETAKLENGKLVIGGCRARENAVAYGKEFKAPAPEKMRLDRLEVTVKDGVATVVVSQTDGNGKPCGQARTFTARRIPAIPAAPCLKSLKYGASIDLLASGMADWEAMGDVTKRHFGWTMKDGILSNRIARKSDGTPKHGDLNIKTKRADFEDFKISYDVRVPAGCNSGVYLRGIYELQVIDSYGKSVNPHNMAALYGRVTPRVAAEKPAGEWQHVDAILCDRHVTVVLNGVNIIDNAPIEGVTGGALTSDEFKPGPIYLQGDHSDADYRNMILTPIVK